MKKSIRPWPTPFFWFIFWFFGWIGIYIPFHYTTILLLLTESPPVYISISQIERKWGHQEFNARKFKEGLPHQRAAMAADLLEKHLYLGKTAKELEADLGKGEQPGYYLLKTPEKNWLKNAGYFLDFNVNEKTQKITRADVYKRCCLQRVSKFWNETGLVDIE